MRVLIINQSYYPDVTATAQHIYDLSLHLVDHGHQVSVIASRSTYGTKGVSRSRRETLDGVDVYRVGRSFFGKSNIFLRVFDSATFYVQALFKACAVPKPDAVVCLTTPPFIALMGWLMSRLRRCRFVYWVMDLYPDVAVICGTLTPNSHLTRLLERVNRFCLTRADRTIVVGRCMLERVREKGISGDHVQKIGIWSHQRAGIPIPHRQNPFRQKWNLEDRFVVMYSGNLGLGHEVATICDAVKILRDDDRIRFLFVGGGHKMSMLQKYVTDNCLHNVIIAPYQPRELLQKSLSCGDLHLATLIEGAQGLMVPCKLLGVMAASRPCVFVGNPSSELARVLTENDCGFVVREGQAKQLVDIVCRLAAAPHLCRQMGVNARLALRREYDRERSWEAWRHLLEDVTDTAPPQSDAISRLHGDADHSLPKAA